MNLTGTTQALELETGSALSTDVVVSWSDIDKTGATAVTPGSSQANVSTATTTVIVAAPAASVYRVITSVAIVNRGGAQQAVVVKKDVAGTEYHVARATLETGESLTYEDGAGWTRRTADGQAKLNTSGLDGAPGATGAPGVGVTGEAVLDFGAFPGASDAAVVITGQAAITADSTVEAWLRMEATADHTADEHRVESLAVTAGSIVPGTGFTVYGRNTSEVYPSPQPLALDRRVGGIAGPASSVPRPSLAGQGTRISGRWTVTWRWS